MADIWKAVAKVVELTDGECIFIGGIAVYAYTQHSGMTPEATDDIDASVTAVAGGTLRDREVVVKNKRLKKAQITVDSIEVDIYIEYQNDLRFQYSDLAMYADTASIGQAVNIKLASLPHLLLLKIDAWQARGSSEHGNKDRRDVAKILVLLGERNDQIELDLFIGSSAKSDLSAIARVIKSTAFMEITRNNAQAAAKLRAKAQAFVDRAKKALKS
jgi:hypothetical protein